jgi:oligopeptide transport system ATP-binding protein
MDEARPLALRGLCKRYRGRAGWLGRARAVEALVDVDLDVEAGATTALVGSSGCGKSSTALCALRLIEPDRGSIRLEGRELMGLSQAALRPLRPRMQAVFQDPWASLHPRQTVEEIIGEALSVHGLATGSERTDRVERALAEVGLPAEAMGRRPGAFSGGQRQRIAIARAIALEPRLLVCDEPTSALDPSIQAQILALLERLQHERGLGLLLITHDLGVARRLARRVVVMAEGRIVEDRPCEALFEDPRHPESRALLDAARGTTGAGH